MSTPMAASVVTLLPVLSRVTLPPSSTSLSATREPLAPSVTVPAPLRAMVLFPVAVSAPLMVTEPALINEKLSLRVISPPMVMLSVVALPMVISENPSTKLDEK